jgi:MFS family permease
MFRSATTADGAGTSGLSSLTYATMMNYAADAAIAVALANTLFFAAATAESRANVALYLLITVAPFAVVAPVIGPLLDRVQRGRRVAMAVSFGGRSLLLIVMAVHLEDWLLYPAALGFMVLSKSFNVLKAAVTPRVLPPDITLVKTNSRISVFGLAAGGVIGGVAAGFAALLGSEAALWFTAVVCVAGVWLCLRIPGRVEVTEGETPASLRAEPATARDATRRRQPMGRSVVMALWGNGTARLLTGFLTLFIAFVVKAQTEGSPGQQLLLLGAFGAAGGAGSFLGNGLGARMHFGKPEQVIVASIVAGLAMAVTVALVQGIVVATVTALVAGTGSALCKVCLDAVIQRDMPESSRASAFGRSETVLQLSWVIGGALGVLLPPTYWIGFGTLSVLFALGLTQTVLVRRGSSLLPGLGGDRPLQPDPVPRRRRSASTRYEQEREWSTADSADDS